MNIGQTISKEDKLKAIGLPIDFNKEKITDDILDEIYNEVVEENQKKQKCLKNVTGIKKSKYEKVDNDSTTYKLTLNLLNDLLKQFGKNPITEITQFRDIDRNNLLDSKCDEILNAHINEIINHFGKTRIRYNTRSESNCYVLSLIKYLTSLCGYTFSSTRSNYLVKDSHGKYDVEGTTYYHIIL